MSDFPPLGHVAVTVRSADASKPWYTALFGAEPVLDARALLRPGGRLVLECGDGQAAGLAEALWSLGYTDVLVKQFGVVS